jgi:imidazole glycerol phosphate synthase glutamine amidotransferase subunit
MAAANVVVVSTGSANLASVFAGLRRLDAPAKLCESADEIASAAHVILPGVGAFGSAMEKLAAAGFVEPLRERITAGRATLCVCLGMHLLAQASEESPGFTGLGVIDATVARFPDHVRVPQFGWNYLEAQSGCDLLESGYAYFANSFRYTAVPDGWSGALAQHGGPFAAALERGAVLTCQFHPELSGPWGQALLKRWLTKAPTKEAAAC